MKTDEIILILAKLAESEGLHLESPCNNEITRSKPACRGGSLERSRRALSSHSSPVKRSGGIWTSVSGFARYAASNAWRYVRENYGVSVHVQVLPVNDLLMRLEDPHRERLADKMRKLLNEHSVVDLNDLADKIQEDSPFARKIVLRYLVEYLTEDMALPVKLPAKND